MYIEKANRVKFQSKDCKGIILDNTSTTKIPANREHADIKDIQENQVNISNLGTLQQCSQCKKRKPIKDIKENSIQFKRFTHEIILIQNDIGNQIILWEEEHQNHFERNMEVKEIVPIEKINQDEELI